MGAEGTMLNKVIQIQYNEHCKTSLICEIKQQEEQQKAKVSSRALVICDGRGKENLGCDLSEYWDLCIKQCLEITEMCAIVGICPYSRSHMLP